jgi:hypothetical protein
MKLKEQREKRIEIGYLHWARTDLHPLVGEVYGTAHDRA